MKLDRSTSRRLSRYRPWVPPGTAFQLLDRLSPSWFRSAVARLGRPSARQRRWSVEPKRLGYEDRRRPSEKSQMDKENGVTAVANAGLRRLVRRGFYGQGYGSRPRFQQSAGSS